MENIKLCPFCGEQIKSIAIKCRHCGSMLTEGSVTGQSPTNNPDTLVRQALGDRYEILGVIGRGGMALVYKAVQRNLGRIVALKVIHQNLVHDHEFITRFLREAQLSASLSHPNIVTVYDIGTVGQIHYMAMEYLEGEDLHLIIKKEGKIPAEKVVRWIIPIAEALDYIHNKGLLHRDIKSANIFITKTGRSVLMDFGIALASDGTKLTMVGSVMGTPEYMSPEQAIGIETNGQSDLWSLGVVLYDCLSGRVPFKGDNPLTTIHLLANSEPQRLDTLNSSVPAWLSGIVMKLLEKDRSLRFTSGHELAEALRSKKVPVTIKKSSKPYKGFIKPKEKSNTPAKGSLQLLPWVIGLLATIIACVFIWMVMDTNKPKDILPKTNQLAQPADFSKNVITPIGKPQLSQPKENPVPSDKERADDYEHAGDLLVESGNYSKAIDRYQSALSLLPGQQSVISKLNDAQSKLREQQQTTAAENLSNRQKQEEQSRQQELAREVLTLIKDGDQSFTSNNFDNAINKYRAALSLMPDNGAIKQKLNRAETEKNRFETQRQTEEKLKLAAKTKANEADDENKVYSEVEEMPQFPGGDLARMRFLAENIRYPQSARDNGIQGAVSTSFVVESSGNISNISINRSIGGGCDEEAVRIIRMMPRWIPGKQHGRPVRVKCNLSIRFTS